MPKVRATLLSYFVYFGISLVLIFPYFLLFLFYEYSHSEKCVKEAQHTHPKILNRKGSVANTPLERLCSNVVHKDFNQILMHMANTPGPFRATECTARLSVSDKISTINKAKAKISATAASDSSGSAAHNISASAGDSHPNFKTAMCRYGDRCIYGERCRYVRTLPIIINFIRYVIYLFNIYLLFIVLTDVISLSYTRYFSFAHNESELRLPTYAVAAPASPDPETIIPSTSIGPGGGAGVVIVSPITKSISNEAFVMQKDDFPGLPGSSKPPPTNGAAPRTAASVVAGGSVMYPPAKPSPVAAPPLPPMPPPGPAPVPMHNAPPPPPAAASAPAAAKPISQPRPAEQRLDPFSLSDLGRAMPEASSATENGRNNLGFSGGDGGFPNYFQSSSPPAAGGLQAQTQAGYSGFGAADFMSVSSLGGSVYNSSNSDAFGGGYLSGLSQSGGAPVGSRFDFPQSSGQQQQLQQQQQQQQQKQQQQQQQQLQQQQQQLQQQQQQHYQAPIPAPVLPPPKPAVAAAASAGARGIDGDLVPLNSFAAVDWLRDSDMGVYRWSGNDRAWTEFAMHVPANFFSFFSSNLPTWLQHSNCRMWFDTDILRGETQHFLVFRRGETGEESNNAMQRALELISHHLHFILKNGNTKSAPEPAPRPQGW
jgi:hypothetical protein